MSEPAIRAANLQKTYRTGGDVIHAVHDVSLSIYSGELTAIAGRSGAGKTTLLNLLSGLDAPDSGTVWIEGDELSALAESNRLRLRREKIGFIFQNFGLLPLLSARENVSVPLRMRHIAADERERRVTEALDWVGLSKRMHHRPYELSGGEQQRVAIARALAAHPKILLADEPTGQLDSQTGKRILQTLHELTDQLGITLVIVTHDPQVIAAARRVYEMQDGKLTAYHGLNDQVIAASWQYPDFVE